MKMMHALLSIFEPSPHLPTLEDSALVQSEYKYWRQRIFLSLLFGYALYYFTRRSFTFAMPGLISDLGFDKAQLGILGSILSISYGMSKFISGILADKSNPRYFMPLGLFLTGVCNLCFGLSSSLGMFIVFWGLNGLFQGFGWPACARTLTRWYSVSERGTWWSSVSVAHNLGAFVTPWIVGMCLQLFGWRAGMYLPGIVCMAGSFLLMNRLRDTPESIGLPSIEQFRNDRPSKAASSEEAPLSTRELLKGVLSNKYIWILAVAYFFVYILRMGISDWTALFLYEVKNYGAFSSSSTSSLFEAGGFCGCLLAGWTSDKFFGAKRMPACVICALGIFGSLFLFWTIPPGYWMLDWIAVFLMGFFVFGPQMLIGICASEICHKRAVATANGFVGWVAYIGASVAGWPMGYVIDRMGWNGAIGFLLICAAILFVLLAPIWNITNSKADPQASVAYA